MKENYFQNKKEINEGRSGDPYQMVAKTGECSSLILTLNEDSSGLSKLNHKS